MSFLTLPVSTESVPTNPTHSQGGSGTDGAVKPWNSGGNDTVRLGRIFTGAVRFVVCISASDKADALQYIQKKQNSIAMAQIYTALIPYNSTIGLVPVGSYWLAPGFQRHVASRKH